MRRLASTALLSVTAPLVLALPVATGPSDEPRPVRPGVQQLAVRGVDAAAARAEKAGRATAVLTTRRDTREFSTLGVTWADDAAAGDVAVQVRTRADGRWSPWTPLDVIDDAGPDDVSPESRGERSGTSPLFVGDADGVQVKVDTSTGAAPDDVRVELIDPGTSPADDDLGQTAPASTATAEAPQPPVIRRAEWGADERLRTGSPSYAPTIKAFYVHHTASTNSYTREQAAQQVRGFYAYHTSSLGWSDLAYNFLVDRYGRIYEGRYGGIDRAVVGAHAGGFNTGTMGVAMIGTHTDVAPTPATLDALAALLAWKVSAEGADATGKTVLTSGGGSTAKYAAGQTVTVPVIPGHRDTNSTACPGNAGYATLPGLRDAVAKRVAATSVVNPIDAKHAALGGDTGLLGPAVGPEQAVADGRFRPYRNGRIYWSRSTGAREVHGGILQTYLARGGPTGGLGFPVGDEVGVPGGRMSAFRGGVVVYRRDTGAIVTIAGGIGEKYRALGGPDGALGLPVSEETAVPGGVRATFDRGHLYWSPTYGARAVVGGILENYLASGGPGGPLGLPRTDEEAVPGGRASTFARGVVTWSTATGARRVVGGIYERYAALGGPRGSLGLAASDETPVPGGARSTFTKGHVYWSPAAGARALYGGVLDSYLANGGPAGVLGLPTSEEGPTPGGRVATFARGRVYWSSGTGAHAVLGAIGDKHAALGGPGSFLGLPRTPEQDVVGGRRQAYVGGEIYWSAATGAREVHGGILLRYLQDGGAARYGLPTSDEHDVPGGRRSTFQRAHIVYDSATGAITVRPL